MRSLKSVKSGKGNKQGRAKVIQRLTKELEGTKIFLKQEEDNLTNYKPNIEPKFQSDYVPIIYDTNIIRRNREWVTNEIAKTFSGSREEALERAKKTVENMAFVFMVLVAGSKALFM